jgi:CRISPR-associated endonuclease/helicase Cas3
MMNDSPLKLLAKSGLKPPSLCDHTIHVMDAGETLFGTADKSTRLGERWLAFFQLPSDVWPRFHANLLVACALHDWGKANDRMHDVLHNGRGTEQAIRHEHFSALLIAQKPCWDWLAIRPELDRELILSAVLTHHLKAGSKLDGFATPESVEMTRFRSLHDCDDFSAMVSAIVERLHLPMLDLSPVPIRWTFGIGPLDVYSERKRVQDILHAFRKRIDPNLVETDAARRRLLHAVRSALIAADAAGSGLVREGKTIKQWIRGQFDESKAWTGSAVWRKVIDKRTDYIAQLTGQPFKWNDFQIDCANKVKVPARSLLLAPCGSGKTLAAWRWIAAQLDERPAGHVLFLYPTRATATEGFRDYVSWAPDAEATLMHGTSEFDLDGMFENGDDPRHENKYEAERRLFALGFWGRRAFSATVDQFLAFMSYGYGPICMMPVLADSVVVIDEIHSFDRRMFAALKGFLRNFNVPVLCMTATMPLNRRDELIKPIAEDGCGLKLYDDRPDDLKNIADAKRYRLRRVASPNEAEVEVRKALRANKRVLWVVNTVKRAHVVVARFVKQLPLNPPTGQAMEELRTILDNEQNVPVICYHSRFRLSDRVGRHQATMRALKEQPGPALGVTTQVCEMSLDIDVWGAAIGIGCHARWATSKLKGQQATYWCTIPAKKLPTTISR